MLREHGEAITTWFYRDLFDAHPELLNIFNPSNQRNGSQARSLAAAILSYAAAIDAPQHLAGMVERIGNKHGSLEVRPEHYPIVGHHLLRAIRGVLGDAATDEILEAWGAAYGVLADIMIAREAELYAGGWAGYKSFRVERRIAESETMTSFWLVPVDGTLLPFRPGQYLGVKVRVPDHPYEQIRQYSLSCAPNDRAYRISVKREPAPEGALGVPAGLVSNHLHDRLHEGDELFVHAPLGDFVVEDESDRPIVLLSGGAGITPAISMLADLANRGEKRELVFVHATTRRSHHAFREELRDLAATHANIRSAVFYEHADPSDRRGVDYDEIGRVDAARLRRYLPAHEADFYTSGPPAFVAATARVLDALGVSPARRHDESFAPDPSFGAESAA